MGLSILAEALARIEHKLDLLLDGLFMKNTVHNKVHFIGQTCPVCLEYVDYQIDVQHQVVVRRCGCKTGKIPSAIPLLPVAQPGTQNGYPTPDEDQRASDPEDRDRRKAR